MSMDGILVEGFRHRSGKNCGSTALFNVSTFWGNRVSEEVIFGLGSGLSFFYGGNFGGVATYMIGGRNPALVEDFFENIGVPKRWQKHGDFPFEKILSYLREGIPVLAQTDLFYLGYYPNPVHFPGHEIVIFGWRERNFIVSDSAFEEPQKVSPENLRKAMMPPPSLPLFTLENHIMPVEKFSVRFDRDSILKAVGKVVERMTIDNPYVGLGALRRFADELLQWADADDFDWCARFAYQVISKRGTGGGLFRFMWSEFLKASAEKIPELREPALLFRESGDEWERLALIFKEIFKSSDKKLFAEAQKKARKIFDIESKAFGKLSQLVK